jgi:hypothetical protein
MEVSATADDSAIDLLNSPLGLGYYGPENDVSYCIVSNILVARLTRWQLVFEDYYRTTNPSAAPNTKPAIWLARGAPKRWFTPASGGLNVSNAPTRTGRVSFSLTVDGPGLVRYSVSVAGAAVVPVIWRVRVPGKVAGVPRCVSGCNIAAIDQAGGIVAVEEAALAHQLSTRSFEVAVGFAS